jgi:hypothetical protein
VVSDKTPATKDPDQELYRAIIETVLSGDEDRALVDLINLALAPEPAEEKLRRWIEDAL